MAQAKAAEQDMIVKAQENQQDYEIARLKLVIDDRKVTLSMSVDWRLTRCLPYRQREVKRCGVNWMREQQSTKHRRRHNESVFRTYTPGRDANERLNDEVLNRAFDLVVEKWMRAIIGATPSQSEEILEAKRRIDAVQEIRRTLKMWVEDGELAQAEQDEDEK